MQSWIFSIINPVFSVTWSSEIIWICLFADQIIINAENSCAASYFSGNYDTYILGIFDEQKVQNIWDLTIIRYIKT